MEFQMYANLSKVKASNKDTILSKISSIVKNVFDIQQNEKDICGPTLVIDDNTIHEDGTLGLACKFYFPNLSKEYKDIIKECFNFLNSMTTNRKSFTFNIEKDLSIKNSKILSNKRFHTSINSINVHYDLINDKEHLNTFKIDELIDYIEQL